MTDITLGQYFPGKSFFHKLDPRTKLLWLVLMIVLIFVAQNMWAVGFMLLMTLFSMIFTGVPLKLYFKGLKAIWFILLISAILNIFYIKGTEETLLLSWWKIEIYTEGVRQCIIIAIRLVSLILCSSVLSFTTSPTQLTGAIEWILSPLKLFKVKVHELSMMMTIALRFVPTLLEETEKILNAQKSRGADMESGGVLKRVKALVPVLIPLFVSSYRRAFDLATAMECRCYTGDGKRTRLNVPRFGFLDFLMLVVACGMTAMVVLLNMDYFALGGVLVRLNELITLLKGFINV